MTTLSQQVIHDYMPVHDASDDIYIIMGRIKILLQIRGIYIEDHLSVTSDSAGYYLIIRDNNTKHECSVYVRSSQNGYMMDRRINNIFLKTMR